jgi:carboxyl-terminal processing protease
MNTNGQRLLTFGLAGCLVAIMMTIAFVAGTGVGLGIGRWTAPAAVAAPANETVDTAQSDPDNPAAASGPAAQVTVTPRPAAQNRSLDLFWEVMGHLQDDYYGEVPGGQELEYAAIRGVVNSLGDDFTSFLTPAEADAFDEMMDGSFEGIGAQVDKDEATGGIRIVDVYENQPAARAGIRRNDVILEVDGQDITALSLNEAIARIRGPRGTDVTLTLLRPPAEEPIEVVVTRERIQLPLITSKRLANDIVYVKLDEFSAPAAGKMKEALTALLRDDPAGLILDLRGNPGGLLDVAVEIGSQFVGEGDILSERFADGTARNYPAEPGGLATSIPLAVLVDEGSASASEIIAGAIQDTGRGPLIGTQTFGKGSVQLPIMLSDGSMLRVTRARWFTPEGRAIHGTGLVPNIVVERSDADRTAGRDPQLDRAIRYLRCLDPAAKCPGPREQ